MDGQSPELIGVTLQRTETNGRPLKYYHQHSGVPNRAARLWNCSHLFLFLALKLREGMLI